MSLPNSPPDVLADDDVTLRIVRHDDWLLDYALSRDPEVCAGTTFPRQLSEPAARARVARAISRRDAGESARYVVERAGQIVGLAGIASRGDGEVEIYYALLPVGRGQGLAARAAGVLADWADRAGARRVVLVTFPGNRASQRTAFRAGFRRVGSEQSRGHDRGRVLVWAYHAGGGQRRTCTQDNDDAKP